MIFRECTAYKLLGFDVNQDRLNQAFSQFCFTPAHETSRYANGFVSPISERPDDFAVQIQHILAFNLRFDEKKVPAKKVNALTDKRVAEIEAKGTHVTKQLKSDIRENAEKDLLKLELPSTTLVYGFIDSKDGWIYFNSKSARVCESALALIRKALGSFRVLPVTTKSAPSHFLCLSLCEEYVHLADGMIIDTGGKIKAVGDKPSHKVSFDGVEIGEHELKVLSGTDIVQADLLIREKFDDPESNSWTFTLTTQKGNNPFALSKLNYAPRNEMDFSPYEEKNDIDFLADLLISANLLSLVFQRLGDSFGGFTECEDSLNKTVVSGDLSQSPRHSLSDVVKLASMSLPKGMTITDVKSRSDNAPESEPSRYQLAKSFVISEQRVGVAMLQRHFKIGYSSAEELVKQLEQEGVISPPNSSHNRIVMISEDK